MVKLALFSAWARLQMASNEQQYLTAVVQPYLALLTPLWLSSLKEFARLRFEPDISGSLGTSLSGDLDEVYAALNRETLLKVCTPLHTPALSDISSRYSVVLSRFLVEPRGRHRQSRREGQRVRL